MKNDTHVKVSLNDTTVNVSFNLGNLLSYAFLGFLTILAVKFVVAMLALVVLPSLDGQSLYAAGGLILKLTSRWFLSLVAGVIVSLVVCLMGGRLRVVLGICAVLGVLGSFI